MSADEIPVLEGQLTVDDVLPPKPEPDDDPVCPKCGHPIRLHSHRLGCTRCDCRPEPKPEPDDVLREYTDCESCGHAYTDHAEESCEISERWCQCPGYWGRAVS